MEHTPHLQLKRFIVGPLEVNCYLLWNRETGDAICIDPGDDTDRIAGLIEEKKLQLRYIINTHGHFDHIGGNALLKGKTGAALAIHENDVQIMREAASQGLLFGATAIPSPEPDFFLKEGDNINLGETYVIVIHTPGHTKGSVSLHIPQMHIIFTGDTLFAGGIGRTDLFGGSLSELMNSIKKKLLTLNSGTKVFPGHGPETTIGQEKGNNPFLI